MTSTHDLIAQIPDYMMGIISTHLIGHACDVRALSEALSDADRLEKIVSALPQEQKTILMDIYELGSQVSWEILSRIYPAGLDTLRAHLEELGSAGLLFQNGLTDADQIILLPSLNYLLEELRRSNFRAPTELTWKQKLTVSIWGHLSLLNTIRAFRIRCKGSLEPFKKGWELLGEKLESLGDIRTIYEELVDLGCIREVNGEVAVQGRAALALAMEGDARYSIWRFLQSCKTSPGLEFQVFNLVGEEAVSREFFLRILNLHHASTGEDAEGSQRTMPLHGDDQVDLWIGLGLLQEDTTGRYLRFADGVFRALKTGKTDQGLASFSDEVIIQPTMEILVPRDFDPVDLLNIGEISDLVRADVVSIYKISRESVYRALLNGWKAEKILHFLDRISRHAIPDNVGKNIAGWSLTHPEAHIISGTFLVVNDSRSILPQGLEEVLSGIYRIPEKCDVEIANFLEKKGVMVRKIEKASTGEDEIEWGRLLPLKESTRALQKKLPVKQAIYPFGMVTPLPYGPKRELVFEHAIQEGRTLYIFYPRQGYGEIQLKHISPISLYRRAGIPFVEAFCEKTGEAEVLDISKVRALFRST